MPRYKTVGAARCANGHMRLFDERFKANSSQEAMILSVNNVRNKPCETCGKRIVGDIQVIGTEEISLHARYFVHGYICECGKRVEVYRVEEGTGYTPPASVTMYCSCDRPRTIQNQEFPSLRFWVEETN